MSAEEQRGEQGSLNYDASSIQVLEGLEGVRKRPSMYIGDTASAGLHHVLWEVVDNSVDEAQAGRCSRISITLHKDGSISVLDDGAGIPTDLHPKLEVPALEVILTKLHAGGKFDRSSYKVSGGLHGVGVSVVNALASWLEVEVYRDGKMHRQTFERGKKSSELAILGETDKHGTLIRFQPDPEIFEVLEFVPEIIQKRIRELAYLMGSLGLRISFTNETTEETETHHYPDGLLEFVRHLNSSKDVLHEEPIYVSKTVVPPGSDLEYGIEAALLYNDGYNENVYSFVNNINTLEGGTHLSGFKTALTRTLNQFAKTNKLFKEKEKPPSGEDLREGLCAVLLVKVPEPQFESQTKIRLGNREVEGIVANVVGAGLKEHFEKQPAMGRIILQKAVQAARAREAARKAREQIRRKSAMESSTLPLKLADCHKGTPRDKAEIFLVEGDSAGGSAVTGRAGFQAILPLRGKILNVEKAPIHKVMDHREIEAIVQAIGTGFATEDFDESKLRYSKIIIMTDADVDGSHIRTLLLTFFYRKMPELVRRGYIYVAQPPLFLLQKGRKQVYVHSLKELDEAVLDFRIDRLALRVGDVELRGAKLREAVTVLRTLREESNLDPAKDGYGLSDLCSVREASGSWPTQRIVLRSERASEARATCLELGASAEGEAGEDSLFFAKGEEALDGFLQALSSELPDARISFAGEEDEDSDVVVEPIHVAKKLTDLVEHAERCGVPASRLDRPAPGGTEILARTGSEEQQVDTLFAALSALTESAGKDVDIKRFKGLGEMEAQQLWESTMDPERRVLYRVELADDVGADNLFTVLMGSVVEPRRAYIEEHALEVTNLDV